MNICEQCGNDLAIHAKKCKCGWNRLLTSKEIKKFYDVPRESYDQYYAMMCRKYPDLKHLILTPEQAKAMVEEVQEARKRGEDKTKEKRMFLKEFAQMFGKIS